MTRVLAAGVALTALVTALLARWLGDGALVPAAVFGFIATGIQAVAHRLALVGLDQPRMVFPKGWLYGMGLRLAGVVLVAVAVVAKRSVFPPLPTAFGFLGVLVPLLFLELRATR